MVEEWDPRDNEDYPDEEEHESEPQESPFDEKFNEVERAFIREQHSERNRGAAEIAYDVMEDIQEHLLSTGRGDKYLVRQAAALAVYSNITGHHNMAAVKILLGAMMGGGPPS